MTLKCEYIHRSSGCSSASSYNLGRMTANKLKLKDSKTEFFITASQFNHRHHKPSNITLFIRKKKHQTFKTIRNLGAAFDSEMTMSSHITLKQNFYFSLLRNIGRIRKYIDQSTRQHAIRSLILSRLDYHNGLLSSLSSTYVIRLQRVQNWASRLVFEVYRKQSLGPLLKSLHWLPVKQRITFKLLLFINVFATKDLPMWKIDNFGLLKTVFGCIIPKPEY